MTKNPAFLFYHFDWLRDTSVRMLTDAERGIYVDILCHSYQRGGKLWLKTGEGTPTLNDLSRLLGLEQNKCAQVLANLVRLGCLDIDENGVYFNKRMFHDVQVSEARSAAGKRGGIKSSASGETLKNLKQFQDSTEANSEASPKQTPKQTPNLSYSSSVSNNINSHTNARAREDEPLPRNMPNSEAKAIEMCLGAGVPDDFIRQAFQDAYAVGFRDRGNPIINWKAYISAYWMRYQNAQKRKESQKQAQSKPQARVEEPREVIHLKRLN